MIMTTKDIEKFIKENNITYFYYFLLEKMLSIFEYDNIPDGVDINILETILCENGSVGIFKSKSDSSKYICVRGSRSKNLNEYGLGENYTGATVGYNYDEKIDENCIIGYNNKLYQSDCNFLYKYALLLNEIDISLDLNVKYSRLLPIPRVKDNKEKIAIENSFNAIKNGTFATVIDTETLSRFIDTNKDSLLKLTDVKDSDKIQHLTNLREEVMKIIMSELGVKIDVKNKGAQVNSTELNAFNDYVNNAIYSKYTERVKMCDNFNKVFGGNWSVKMSIGVGTNSIDNKCNNSDADSLTNSNTINDTKGGSNSND